MKIRAIADTTGIIFSSLCAIHCLATPLFLLLTPLLPFLWLPSESFHIAMLWILIPSGVIAFSLGCRKHKDKATLLLGIVGMLGLLLSATLMHNLLGETGETIVTVFSTITLVAGHVRNYRLCRKIDCVHERVPSNKI